MKKVNVTAYPYAVQYGTIEVPEELTLDELEDYVSEHFDEVDFDAPELDYQGTDLEFS